MIIHFFRGGRTNDRRTGDHAFRVQVVAFYQFTTRWHYIIQTALKVAASNRQSCITRQQVLWDNSALFRTHFDILKLETIPVVANLFFFSFFFFTISFFSQTSSRKRTELGSVEGKWVGWAFVLMGPEGLLLTHIILTYGYTVLTFGKEKNMSRCCTCVCVCVFASMAECACQTFRPSLSTHQSWLNGQSICLKKKTTKKLKCFDNISTFLHNTNNIAQLKNEDIFFSPGGIIVHHSTHQKCLMCCHAIMLI